MEAVSCTEAAMNPLVAEIVASLSAEENEIYEERVAIMVVDAGYSQEYAECLAILALICSGEITILSERNKNHGRTNIH
jgi:hypothetical protein